MHHSSASSAKNAKPTLLAMDLFLRKDSLSPVLQSFCEVLVFPLGKRQRWRVVGETGYSSLYFFTHPERVRFGCAILFFESRIALILDILFTHCFLNSSLQILDMIMVPPSFVLLYLIRTWCYNFSITEHRSTICYVNSRMYDFQFLACETSPLSLDIIDYSTFSTLIY